MWFIGVIVVVVVVVLVFDGQVFMEQLWNKGLKYGSLQGYNGFKVYGYYDSGFGVLNVGILGVVVELEFRV